MNKTDTKIIELKNGGKSLRQIAKQVGISHVAVKKRLDRLGNITAIRQGISKEHSKVRFP